MAELSPLQSAGDFRLAFAGDTFNTAWYFKRLEPEAEVNFCSAVGDDSLSDKLRAAVRDSGIDDRHMRTIAGKTVGLYLISLDKGERSFSYWRGQSAARDLALSPDALAAAMDAADLIYFSGITLAILDTPSRANLFAALAAARKEGKTVAFDPNLRPRLWSDMTEMTRTVMQGAALSDIALPSFEDEAEWFGDATPEATLARYADAGATTVVVKNGPSPVLFRQGAETGSVAVPPVAQVVDTTAAGDSFNAGFLSGHLKGLPIEDAVTRGCRIAAQVVQGKGALVPVPPIP